MKKFTDFQMYKSVALACVFVIIVSNIGFGQTTVTLDPIGDAYVWEMYPNTNYGSDDNLYIGRDPGGEGNNILIQWDLSSLPSCIEVTLAEISLYQWSTYSGIPCAYIKRILDSWNELSVTWATQPSTSSSYGTQCFGPTGGWHYIPVTELVQDWLNYGNDGVMLQATPSSTTYQICRSRENIGHNPQLYITYITGTNSTPPSGATANPNHINLGDPTTLTVIDGSLGTGASWEWYSGDCGGTTPVGSGSSITVFPPSLPTTYYVRAEGACNITDCANVTVYLIVGVEEIDFINDLIIYPNPANDIIYIKTTETGLFIKNLEIVDVIGKSVYQSVLNNSNDLIRISVTDFQPGFYFIKLHTNKGVVLNKFIINR